MNNKEKRWYESFLLVKEHLLLGDESKYEWINNWIQNQRTAYKNRDIPMEERKNTLLPLKDWQVELLKDVGIRLENINRDEEWMKMFQLAKKRYEYEKSLDIQQNLEIENECEIDKKALSVWYSVQRKAYKNRSISEGERKYKIPPLKDWQVDLLNSIEMIWDNKTEVTWMKNFELASIYYKHYGHLNISQRFKTKKGYEYDENGNALCVWIAAQRIAYRNRKIPKEERRDTKGSLTDERVKLLNGIRMIWNVRKNKDTIMILCKQYGIDCKKNNSLFNKTRVEFYAKIRYLFDNNLPITINGEVHEIFNMSDVNMQVKYGVSLKDLLDKYIKGKTRGF